jgi:acetyltransferase-like isoleucine patch superfamily enzyme
MIEDPDEPVDDVIHWLEGVAPDLAEDAARLRTLISLLDQYQRERWHRHVTAGDAVIDRWERARQLGFGAGSSVYDSALVIGDVRVGRNTWIGPHTVLDGSGGLSIGDWCSISSGVQVYSHDSIARALSGGEFPVARASSSIGSNTYIGPSAIIAKGVAIGSKCIVGAASLVLDTLPDGSVAYGTPATVVGGSDEYLSRPERQADSAEVAG